MFVEDVGGWHITLEEPSSSRPRLAGAAVAALGLGLALALSGAGAVLVALAALPAAAGAAGLVYYAEARTRLVIRRSGEQLWCELGGERLWSAPIGEVRGVRIHGDGFTARMEVDRHETARFYRVPGVHDAAVCARLRERILAEARANEREGEAPAALQALREERP